MKKKVLWLIGVFLVLSLVVVGCSPKTGGEIDKDIPKEEVGSDINTKEWLADLNSQDLDGNKIDKEIFSENDLTLVNAWATWCGPCLMEIEDLGDLAREMEDHNVGVKGIIVESNQQEGIIPGISEGERKLALEILEDAGADYQQILVSEDMLQTDFLNLVGFPTTYFVDKEGNFVGKEVVGAKSKDDWKAVILDRLEMVK